MIAGASATMTASRRSQRWRAAACILLAAAFLPTLGAGFILDDYFLLGRAARPLTEGGLAFAMRSADAGLVLWAHPNPIRVEFFRPLVMLTLWLEHRVWGGFAPLYHVDNVILHVGVVFLVARLARRLGLHGSALRWTVLGWCLCVPAVTAVDWVSGRTEIIAAACTLSAVLAFLEWRDRRGALRLAAATAFAALAACAKESGVMAPALIAIASALDDALRERDGVTAPRPGLAAYALVAAPAIVVVVVRFAVLRVPAPEPPYLEPLWGLAAWARFAAKIPLQALFSIFSIPVSHIGPLDQILARPLTLAVALALVAAAATVLVRAAGRRRGMLLIAWFVAAVAPSLPVVATSLYAYLPMVGLALLVGFALQTSGRRWFTAWLASWIALGVVGSIATSLAAGRASRAMREGVAFVSRETADGRTARVAIVDAPFWLFALPAALRLEHPERKFDTWFVNCNPRVLPGEPSTLAFTPRGDLDVRSREGGFFHSPIQRFLAFGATAGHAPPPAEGAPMGIVPLEPGADPAALRIRFRDAAARDSTCVVQFRGWTPVRITWRGAATSALGGDATPALSPGAPSRPAPARR